MTTSPPPDLSVVLISRNQRWNIDRLIESVHASVGDAREVVLVDSGSTDGTPEAAAAHGIRVLRLDPDQHLSPSAGRYVGYEHTSGAYTLFLDGDAELVPGWLPLAVSILDADPDVAVVSGARISVPIDTEADTRPDLPAYSDEHRTVKKTGGSALYRRAALELSGQFDPFLHSDEEPDLAIRLRHHGFRIVKTTYPSIFDYTDSVDEIRTIIARRNRNLYLGAGQNLRKHAALPTFGVYVRERAFGLLPIAFFPVYAATGIGLFRRTKTGFLGFLGASLMGFAALAVHKGSVQGAVHTIVLRLLVAEGTIRGGLRPVRNPGEYQPSYREITTEG